MVNIARVLHIQTDGATTFIIRDGHVLFDALLTVSDRLSLGTLPSSATTSGLCSRQTRTSKSASERTCRGVQCQLLDP